MDRRKILFGMATTFLIFALLVNFVGLRSFLTELMAARPTFVGFLFVLVLCWLFLWGLVLKRFIEATGATVSPLKSFFVFCGAMFANNVTPFGQAGGEPITALLLSEEKNLRFEEGLAIISSVDTINFFPSFLLFLIGTVLLSIRLAFSQKLVLLIGVLLTVFAAVLLLIYLIWMRLGLVESYTVSAVTSITNVFSAFPGIPDVSESLIHERVDSFFTEIYRFGGNRRLLVFAFVFSFAGWISQMSGMWVAFRAVGVTIPFSFILFAIPVSALAAITPLPGGAGGIEAVLFLLFSIAPGLTLAGDTLLAAIVLFRGFTYWVPVIVGGTVVGITLKRGQSSS